jgi:hypothetical protein
MNIGGVDLSRMCALRPYLCCTPLLCQHQQQTQNTEKDYGSYNTSDTWWTCGMACRVELVGLQMSGENLCSFLLEPGFIINDSYCVVCMYVCMYIAGEGLKRPQHRDHP